MARSAVLSGRSFADVVYNGGILIVLMLSGLVVGWTVNTGFAAPDRGLRSCCCSSPSRCRGSGSGSGCRCRPSRSPSRSIFTVLFPITFISNVFVPIETLPTWLQPIAEWNPTSTLTGALRKLWGNPNPYATDSFPSQNPLLVTLVLGRRDRGDLRARSGSAATAT